MAFTFGAKQNKKIKPKPGTVHTEPRRAEPTPTASGQRSGASQGTGKSLQLKHENKSRPHLHSTSSSQHLKPPVATKRKAARQASSRTPTPQWGQDSDPEEEEEDDDQEAYKRRRQDSPEDLESTRQAFLRYRDNNAPIITVHAADAQSEAILKSNVPVEEVQKIATVKLQYPGGSDMER